jgi:hypothetical protein
LHRLVAELVDARLELDATRAVDQVQERHLPLPAARGQTPGDAVCGLGLLARLQRGVGRANRGDRLYSVELVRERVDSRSPE